MSRVWEKFWGPRLRKLTKRAVALSAPPHGQLPRERTEGSTPLSVIGVVFTEAKEGDKGICSDVRMQLITSRFLRTVPEPGNM